MIAPEDSKTQVLVEASVRQKLAHLEACLMKLLNGGVETVPEVPGRDVQIWPIRTLPEKPGLSSKIGQARLLHDLASIELQAMELGLRTLSEFPQAPMAFRRRLAEITLEEGQHLRLCLDALDDLQCPWGSFPTHLGLWQAVSEHDELLDRILIVHRYLEGSGLDASETILRRLTGVRAPEAHRAVAVIRRDEVEHVRFGSYWYHALCREARLEIGEDFRRRIEALFRRIPRRMEPIQEGIRREAGFLPEELKTLSELQVAFQKRSESFSKRH